jgi:hypothetical protein
MEVEKLLRRLKIEFLKVNMIQASLDSIILFLSANLLFFLNDLKVAGGLSNIQVVGAMSAVFFLVDLIYRAMRYNVEIYEEKNPELEEILRTARDNKEKSNIASQALFDELVERAGNVTSESIIPDEKIIQKVLIVGVLSFLTLGSGFMGIQIEASPGGEIFSGIENPFSEPETNETDFEIQNASDILGDPESINVEARDLEFEISGSGESASETFSFDAASEEFALESTRRGFGEDAELARDYSLAIRNME